MSKTLKGSWIVWVLGLCASAAASVRLFNLLIEGELVGSLRFIVEAYSRFWEDVFYVLEHPISYIVDFLSWLFSMQLTFLEASQQLFVVIFIFCVAVLNGYRLLPKLQLVLLYTWAAATSLSFAILFSWVPTLNSSFEKNWLYSAVPLAAVLVFYTGLHIWLATTDRHGWSQRRNIPKITWVRYFWLQQGQAVFLVMVGMLVSTAFLAIPKINTIDGSGIFGFYIFLAFTGFYGAYRYVFFDYSKNHSGKGLWASRKRSGNALVAGRIFWLFFMIAALIL